MASDLREKVLLAVLHALRPYLVNPLAESEAVEPITDAVLAVIDVDGLRGEVAAGLPDRCHLADLDDAVREVAALRATLEQVRESAQAWWDEYSEAAEEIERLTQTPAGGGALGAVEPAPTGVDAVPVEDAEPSETHHERIGPPMPAEEVDAKPPDIAPR